MVEHRETYSTAQPQTKRGTERCLAFLDAATTLFLHKGYDAVSLDDIVQYAGGSKASLYKFFGSKEGLFTAICDYRRDIFLKELYKNFNCQSNDIRQFLTIVLTNFYNHIVEPENISFLRLMLERAKHDTQLAAYLYEQGPEHFVEDLARKLDWATKNGKLVCDQPLNSAKMFLGCLWHYEWQALMGLPITKDPQEIEDYIQYTVDFFLKAHQYQ